MELKHKEKKSLTQINEILYEKLGIKYTNARLSQVFTGWKTPEDIGGGIITTENHLNEGRSNSGSSGEQGQV
jgi:hypothetical protein